MQLPQLPVSSAEDQAPRDSLLRSVLEPSSQERRRLVLHAQPWGSISLLHTLAVGMPSLLTSLSMLVVKLPQGCRSLVWLARGELKRELHLLLQLPRELSPLVPSREPLLLVYFSMASVTLHSPRDTAKSAPSNGSVCQDSYWGSPTMTVL